MTMKEGIPKTGKVTLKLINIDLMNAATVYQSSTGNMNL